MLVFTVYASRFGLFVFGVVLVYVAVFLYEDEQGKIQNGLEDLWLRLAERQQTALAQHGAFLHIAARIANSWLDRLFGKQLLSLRSIGVSVCYSLASFLFLVALFSPHDSYLLKQNLILALVFVVSSILPSRIKRPFTL